MGGRKCAQTMAECPKREVKNRTDHRIATLKALRNSLNEELDSLSCVLPFC